MERVHKKKSKREGEPGAGAKTKLRTRRKCWSNCQGQETDQQTKVAPFSVRFSG
jgi:hypothetical protein